MTIQKFVGVPRLELAAASIMINSCLVFYSHFLLYFNFIYNLITYYNIFYLFYILFCIYKFLAYFSNIKFQHYLLIIILSPSFHHLLFPSFSLCPSSRSFHYIVSLPGLLHGSILWPYTFCIVYSGSNLELYSSSYADDTRLTHNRCHNE